MNALIEKLITFIYKNQLPDGSFLSYSSDDSNDFSRAFPLKTVFTTSLIIRMLYQYKDPKSLEIISKAKRFLLAQKSTKWSFNYWNNDTDEYKSIPYPDDLDDTFSSCAALYLAEYQFSGEDLAKITKLLISQETNTDGGGPYKTWIVPKSKTYEAWHDTDIIVNANIGYFLSLLGISSKGINKLINESVKNDSLYSAYYPNTISSLYFISRWHKSAPFTKLLESQKMSDQRTVFDQLLLINSLLENNPSAMKKEYLKMLLNYSEKVILKPYPLYYGVNPTDDRSKKFYAGSPVLTAALYLETIFKYETITKPIHTPQKTAHIPPELEYFKINVKNVLNSLLKNTSKESASIIFKTFEKLHKMKNYSFMLYPTYHFLKDLDMKFNDQKTIINLNVAHILGWITYTLYDDVADEKEHPEYLFAANITSRLMNEVFLSIDDPTFKTYFKKIMLTVDESNIQEITYTTSSKEISPSGKSLGHCLANLALYFLYKEHFPKNTKPDDIIEMYQYFLTARQLLDDLHDWQDDYQAHIYNPIVVKLQKAKKLKNIAEMETYFWKKLAIETYTFITNELNKSIHIMHQLKMKPNAFHLQETQRLLTASKNNIEEIKNTKQFISSFEEVS